MIRASHADENVVQSAPTAFREVPAQPVGGRRWLLRLALALVAGAAAAALVWSLWPAPKHFVRTLIHVPRPKPIVRGFVPVQGAPEIQDYQRTQVALARSRLVLNAALRNKEVARLSMVAGHVGTTPVEWLEGEVVADFQPAPEILRIGMYGDNPEELVILVNALRDAYLSEILERDNKQRQDRLAVIAAIRARKEEELKEGRKTQRGLEDAGATKDAAARDLALRFAKQQLERAEQELLQVHSDLRKARLELAAAKAHEKGAGDSATAKSAPATKSSAPQDRIALLDDTERALQKEVEDRRQQVVKFANHGGQLDEVRWDLDQIEQLVKNLAAEEVALKLELDAPKSEQVLEKAVIERPAGPGAGRTAAAVLVVLVGALLAFACLSLRLRVSLR
jgi:hypothetical protein